MESEQSNEEDYVDDLLPELTNKKNKPPRTSVSAEAYGLWNKQGDFEAPSYEKTAVIKEKLKARLE